MQDSDIRSYHAIEVSSAATNGGRMSNNEIISGDVNNVIPHVSRAVRQAGNLSAPLHRKIFTLAEDDADGSLLNTIRWIERVIDAGDFCTLHAGTQTDTQGDQTGSERKYGYAFLKTNITAGDSQCVVTVKHAYLATGAHAIFAAGDMIRPSTMQTPDAQTGTEEFDLEIGSISVNGLDITITLAAGQTFTNSYLVADNAFVVSYMERGDTECNVANFTVGPGNSGSHAYDDTTYPVIPDNIGTVYDHVTCTWINATSFSAVGTSGINYGTFTDVFNTDAQPMNTAKSKPYWTIEAAGHSGTPQANDTFEFDISPASFADWLLQWVPPSCPSLALNKVTAVTVGESAG